MQLRSLSNGAVVEAELRLSDITRPCGVVSISVQSNISPPSQFIRIRKAGEHNLKDIDVDIPRNSFVVITGLSGSGKSSLAFDTIYAEGQRRYVESLSAYARQFLDQMRKPTVESIEGLTPTISIEQRSGKATPRSIVATATEVYDYLRVLFARAGTPFCPVCDRPIVSQSAEDIVTALLRNPEGTRLHVLAPLVKGKKGEHKEAFDYVRREGFTRIRVDGKVFENESAVPLKKSLAHSIEAVVDRIVIRQTARSRLTDSIETALNLGNGSVMALLENGSSGLSREERFSEKFACPEHGTGLDELSPRIFSFNNPYGSCPACSGLGTRIEPATELIVPDPSLSMEEGAIEAWKACGSGFKGFYSRSVRALARLFGISTKTPWAEIDPRIRDRVLFGAEKGRDGEVDFEGIVPNLKRRFLHTESEYLKSKIHGFMTSLPCDVCRGQRLRPEVLSVKVNGHNIHQLTQMTIDGAYLFFSTLKLGREKDEIAGPIKKSVLERLGFLKNVGLGYLTLGRTTNSLSGGEAQRIRLASQIGAKLVGVTYVLDEPTIGLHQRDNHRLLNTLIRLKDLGNTVIVVEHDADIIRKAEYILDMGPGAGEHGGRVVTQGFPDFVFKDRNSLTAKYLRGELQIEMPSRRRTPESSGKIVVKGARANNLQRITAEFPLETLICVTGVSGSGKSSLVNECLLRGMQRELGATKAVPALCDSIRGIKLVDKIVNVDQSPIGRTSKSNPATYTGFFDGIRTVFSQLPEAKVRGYAPSRFSFNVKGGRCEACQGQGQRVIEMHFLPDVSVPCEICKGSRYNGETLQVKYRGKNIAAVLDMAVEEACVFFRNHRKIYPGLKTLMDVGLGYIKLGQSSPTLSGGEAQRIKLSAELGKRSTGKTFYILDEPTTGLHFHDIAQLMRVLQQLVDLGNTVVIIEHNLDVIKCADWIVDLGPDGGKYGGRVIVEGPPEKVARTKESYTGQYLKPILQSGRDGKCKDPDSCR